MRSPRERPAWRGLSVSCRMSGAGDGGCGDRWRGLGGAARGRHHAGAGALLCGSVQDDGSRHLDACCPGVHHAFPPSLPGTWGLMRRNAQLRAGTKVSLFQHLGKCNGFQEVLVLTRSRVQAAAPFCRRSESLRGMCLLGA